MRTIEPPFPAPDPCSSRFANTLHANREGCCTYQLLAGCYELLAEYYIAVLPSQPLTALTDLTAVIVHPQLQLQLC